MKIEAIQFPEPEYQVSVALHRIERWVQDNCFNREFVVDLDPDYQRAHVWTAEQRRAYLEYVLRGGKVSNRIVFTCADGRPSISKLWSLTDGKQRLETVRAFLRDEIRVFSSSALSTEGYLASEIEDLRAVGLRFDICVVQVGSRAEQLALYLALNTAGTPHSAEEIARVQAMLDAELANHKR